MNDSTLENHANLRRLGPLPGGASLLVVLLAALIAFAPLMLSDLRVGAQADTTPPTLVSATVNRYTLTLIFNENLDTSSVPVASAFSVQGAAMGTGTVSIVGATVTVTLDKEVGYFDGRWFNYSGRNTNPLRDGAGNEVADIFFEEDKFTNEFPAHEAPQGEVWSATLTVRNIGGFGCASADYGRPDPADHCASALDYDSFGVTGDVTTVTRIHLSATRDSLHLGLNKSVPTKYTLHVGGRTFPVASDILGGDSDDTATWENPGFTWRAGQKVPFEVDRAEA